MPEHGYLSTHDLTRRSTGITYDPQEDAVFQLTTSQGGRPERYGFKDLFVVFQLTTSQGGRQKSKDQIRFNARLSTHDLTRRSTNARGEYWNTFYLSTHDLTRRSTRLKPIFIFRDFFQLTTSQGGRRFPHTINAYASAFQLTTSQGGRL